MFARKFLRKSLSATTAISMVFVAGCGTLTGIPGHGGGKRFAIEQKLVSATIRASLKDIDVTALKGQKVAIVFNLISDEGGGDMVGGRASLGGLVSAAQVVSPLSSSNSQFQVFDLVDTSSTYQNTTGGRTGTNVATTTTVSDLSTSGSFTTDGLSSGSSQTNSTSNTTTANNGTASTTTASATDSSMSNTGSSLTDPRTNGTTTTSTPSGSSITTTTTPPVTTTQTTTPGIATTNNSTASLGAVSTNTQSTGGSNSSTAGTTDTTQSGTGSQISTGSSNASNSGSTNQSGSNVSSSTETENQATNGSSISNSVSDLNGNTTTLRQDVSNAPSATQSRTKGTQSKAEVKLAYRGLGDYYNMAIPKSDASLLMGLVRNYLLLNDVRVTVPQDREATAIVYVTVDVFGLNRSRSDYYVYNEENVKAETSIEIFAYNKEGKLILSPTVSNYEAEYKESYLLWAGPYETSQKVMKGDGLLEDFSDLGK